MVILQDIFHHAIKVDKIAKNSCNSIYFNNIYSYFYSFLLFDRLRYNTYPGKKYCPHRHFSWSSSVFTLFLRWRRLF